MHGNVWEWVGDCWNRSYDNAPNDGGVNTGGDCRKHVLRGGSWRVNTWGLRSAYRTWDDSDERDIYNGFRLARTLNAR